MEGPGIHLLADELSILTGQQVTDAFGTTDEPIEVLVDSMIEEVRPVKKRVFIETSEASLVFHLLLYGSYRVNASREADEQVALICSEDTVNLYGCSIDVVTAGETTLEEYDRPSEDILSDQFDEQQAIEVLRETDRMVTDVLLDQSVFGGVGNRIKNEVLWLSCLHPTTPANEVSDERRNDMVNHALDWARHWYECKRDDSTVNSKAYQRDECVRCGTALEKDEFGTTTRVTYWCPSCQAP